MDSPLISCHYWSISTVDGQASYGHRRPEVRAFQAVAEVMAVGSSNVGPVELTRASFSVLVVDDDPDTADSFSELLALNGFAVRSATAAGRPCALTMMIHRMWSSWT